jgi:putative peptidoglycan lipid II flippase
VANNVVAIAGQAVFLVLWGRQEDPAAWSSAMVWTLAGSATLGIVVQCLVLLPALHRVGFRWRPRWGLRGQGFGAVGRFSLWTFAALCIGQGGGLVVMSVTTGLAPSTGAGVSSPGQPFVPEYAVYQKALVLFQVVPSLIAVSILTALFPQLARAWQANSLRGTRQIVREGLVLPAVGIIPASAVLVALAGPLVSTIYFTLSPEEARGTALILAVMALSTLFYGIAGWQQQYCFASEQGRANLGMQLLLTLIQVSFALAALLVPAHLGVLTIAVGQVVGNLAVAMVFMAFAQHQLGDLRLGGVVWLYARLGLASLVPGGAAWGLARLITGWNSLWLGQFLACLAGAVVFGVLFLPMARLLHISEFFDLLQRLRPTRRLQPAH